MTDFRNEPTLQIPEEFLTEIGRIAVAWESLDGLLKMSLMKLAGMSINDPRSIIIFHHLSLPLRLDILGAFADELAPSYPNLSSLPAISGKIKDASNKRNQFVHGAWTRNPETGSVLLGRATARGKLKATVREVALSELKDATECIQNAITGLYECVIKGGDAA